MDERDLAQTAISHDFFGAGGVRDDGPPPVPGKYTIAQRLAQGASGTVYLAHDTTLGRSVALKYLNLDRPAEVERFFREARVTARLRHPAIVQVYEAAEFAGLPYIAMQYIPGGDLAGAGLDREATLRVIRQVAEALAHAHAEGIVHRDVKPQNILVDTDGRGYVTDFGIARDLRGDLGDTISYDGQILGTPSLMSPEQARGDVRVVDARTDVYALGATLYHALTGRLPFDGDTLVDLLHAVIHDDPVFPRAHRPDIPRELEALVLRCLQKQPADRYASMREVITALDDLATADRVPQVVPRWFTTYVRRRVQDAPDLPETPPPEPEWLASADYVQEIAAWDAQLYRVRDLHRSLPQLDDLIGRLTGVLEAQPSTGWARFYRGVAWFRRGQLRRALDDMERSVDRVSDLAGAHVELGRLYLAVFFDEHHDAPPRVDTPGAAGGRTARSFLDRAAIAFAEAHRLKHEGPAWQRRYAEAVRRLADGDVERCLGECDGMLAGDPDLDEVWKLQGDALRSAGRDPLPAYERAVDIRRSNYDAWLAMADVHLAGGALPRAHAALDRAERIQLDLVAAQVLRARAHLLEVLAGGGPDALDRAAAVLDPVLEAHPDRYDAVVTVAEIRIERARQTADVAWIAEALEALAHAVTLDGHGHRATDLHAQAQVTRERMAAGGGDPPADPGGAVR